MEVLPKDLRREDEELPELAFPHKVVAGYWGSLETTAPQGVWMPCSPHVGLRLKRPALVMEEVEDLRPKKGAGTMVP